jgi:hypothetical protein
MPNYSSNSSNTVQKSDFDKVKAQLDAANTKITDVCLIDSCFVIYVVIATHGIFFLFFLLLLSHN